MLIIRLAVIPLSLLVDRVTGDPHSRFHPVALLGRFIAFWGDPRKFRPSLQRAAGVVMWFATVAIFSVPFLLAEVFLPWYALLVAAPALLKVCLAWRSLEEHVDAVEKALSAGLPEGREKVRFMVSRDPRELSEDQVRSAAYESLSENLVDSIVAPLFYYALFGLAGAAVYRAANTMDAMLGYRDERERIGWFPARADDVLNYVPARLATGILLLYFAARGRYAPAIRCLRQDAKKRPGYNGGLSMAVIAGGTGVQFEKPGSYTIGSREKALRDAGPDIIAAVRACTLASSALFMLIPIFLALLVQFI
ncbi:MAG: adenosylcobinamide-phosphate synthase CbiB [Methanolinea sp.]|nr:adenosylcobinamide-phosphate synthase CbiB [Methanolinea sp.]